MSLFKFSKPKVQDDNHAVSLILEVAAYGMADNEAAHSPENMERVIAEVEAYSTNGPPSAIVLYYLGLAWRNYTAWHKRGDERKPYLEIAADYYRKAFEHSKIQCVPRLPLDARHNANKIDQVSIAGDLGFLLVEEKLIRNLDEAEQVLSFVARTTPEYEPCLCPYAELYYKKGDYQKAIKVALDAHSRAIKSAEWKDTPPPAPLGIAGMAFRAMGKQAKKDGNIPAAINAFKRLVDLGLASENDRKIYDKLMATAD